MKVLIACEESQTVCRAFREKGHEAYSCDIIDCSGGYPEWHIKQDVLTILNPEMLSIFGGEEWFGIEFYTTDGKLHQLDGAWDLIIAHPPCTYLTVTGNRWFNVERYGEKAVKRWQDRMKAIEFFMRFTTACCDKIAIENPIGCMSTIYRKPDQIIHPYYFGDPERKSTCLWLKGLQALQATNVVKPNIVKYKNGKGTDSLWHMETMNLPPAERSKARSKTFTGVAQAMADQWGNMT